MKCCCSSSISWECCSIWFSWMLWLLLVAVAEVFLTRTDGWMLCTMRWCAVSSDFVRKPSPQFKQACGASVCCRMWATSVRFCRNSCPHTEHSWGTRPCNFPWFTSWNFRGKDAPQSWQTNGSKLPWKRECITKCDSWAKLKVEIELETKFGQHPSTYLSPQVSHT